MRIRKRSEPLGFSILSPTTTTTAALPVSDPPLSKEEEEEEEADQSKTHLHLQPHPSDSLNQSLRLRIIRRKKGWILSDGVTQEKKECCMMFSSSSQEPLQVVESEKQKEHCEDEEEKKRWREKDYSDNIRKGSRLGAEANSRVQPHCSFPSDKVGRWVEGEKLIPLKKRRGNFERKVGEETMVEKEKKMKSKLKTKTTKKWVHEKDQEVEEEDVEEERGNGSESTSVNMKRGVVNGGGALMEGSRCSRVNGRGWRCWQQTLVGYSLCEHHLGKGRLRSMSSVRNHASFAAISSPKKVLEHKEDQEEPLIIHIEKKKKMGMVKTRSINSLLAVQTLPAYDG